MATNSQHLRAAEQGILDTRQSSTPPRLSVKVPAADSVMAGA